MSYLSLAKLTNRSLLRIKGPDTYPYLQGLICNDLRQLYEKDRIPRKKYANESPNVLSSFMLNAQGRAICDMLIYRTPLTSHECKFLPPGQATEHDELLIECDQKLASGLANTLYGYRVRRKITIKLEDGLHLWSLFPNLNYLTQEQLSNPAPENSLVELPTQNEDIIGDDLIVVRDPRLTCLGLRIITKIEDLDHLSSIIKSKIGIETHKASNSDYIMHRYTLGVGEGSKDHPESNCLPLESNADYLNSVSYTKGCYLGQELTARIHYTGVIRKRLMPLQIENIDTSHGALPPIAGADLIDRDTDKKVGTIRSIYKNKGLGLIRTDLLSPSCQLIQQNTTTLMKTYTPFWWMN